MTATWLANKFSTQNFNFYYINLDVIPSICCILNIELKIRHEHNLSVSLVFFTLRTRNTCDILTKILHLSQVWRNSQWRALISDKILWSTCDILTKILHLSQVWRNSQWRALIRDERLRNGDSRSRSPHHSPVGWSAERTGFLQQSVWNVSKIDDGFVIKSLKKQPHNVWINLNMEHQLSDWLTNWLTF
jgi:hypothetical protein